MANLKISKYCLKAIKMKFLLLTFLLTAGGISAEDKSTKVYPGYAQCFSNYDNTGFYYYFTEYVPDLTAYTFSNVIRSVAQKGMWMYYENIDYNTLAAGMVYWVHGIDISVNFPLQYSDMTTSLRYSGGWNALNEDFWTIYDGSYFTGLEMYGNINVADFGSMSGRAESLILVGLSPWTFYTGTSYTGAAVCLYPSTDHDVGASEVLDLGIYGTISGFENLFRSVQKGCWAETVLKAKPLTAIHRGKNGAFGVIDLKEH